MFSDFDQSAASSGRDRSQKTASIVIAALLFAGLAGGLAIALATAPTLRPVQRDVEVEFAALEEPEAEPEPEPEPPPPEEPNPRPRRAAPAAVIDAPPRFIPNERPAEAEGELAEVREVAEETGSRDGFVDGEGGGDPPAPPPNEPSPEPPRPPRPPPRQVRVPVTPPSMLAGCRVPPRPARLEGATAETIRVHVRALIGADGRVARSEIATGHALIEAAPILACVDSRTYRPASLEGEPVPFPLSYVFTFRPDAL